MALLPVTVPPAPALEGVRTENHFLVVNLRRFPSRADSLHLISIGEASSAQNTAGRCLSIRTHFKGMGHNVSQPIVCLSREQSGHPKDFIKFYFRPRFNFSL